MAGQSYAQTQYVPWLMSCLCCASPRLQFDIRNGAVASSSNLPSEPPSTPSQPSHRFSLGGPSASKFSSSTDVRTSTPALSSTPARPQSSAKKASDVLRASQDFLRTSGEFLRRPSPVVPLGDHQPGQQQARTPTVKTVTDQLRASMALPPSNSIFRPRPKAASNRAYVDIALQSEAESSKSATGSPLIKTRTPATAVHTIRFDR